MPQPFTEADGIRLAESVVELWESIPKRLEKFKIEFNCDKVALAAIEAVLRKSAGGEELYNVSKEFLREVRPR